MTKKTETINRTKMKMPVDLSGKTILIADDVYTNFLLLEAILKGTNAKLIWAKNGREAIEKCMNNENIDLVLMDIQMPLVDGIEATREIKKIRQNIPVVAQTAFSIFYEEDEILKAGCSQVLNKPLMPELVLRAVSKYF